MGFVFNVCNNYWGCDGFFAFGAREKDLFYFRALCLKTQQGPGDAKEQMQQRVIFSLASLEYFTQVVGMRRGII